MPIKMTVLKSIISVYICLSLCSCMTKIKTTQLEATQLARYQTSYEKLTNVSWPQLNSDKVILPKQKSPLINELRKRLVLLGDLPKEYVEKPFYFDQKLVVALKKYQLRHGLNEDAIIGKTTLQSLNILPSVRLYQLKNAIFDWQELSKKEPINEYMHVNLASYQLNIFKGKEKTLHMKVVVGNPKWPTPNLESQIQTIVINPKWNIPKNITEKEIIHKISDNIDYLNEENIRILDGWHKGAKKIDPTTIDWQRYAGKEDLPYRLIQGAGEHNALGKIKFTFPNKDHVYLHDTPNKDVFNLLKRNLSHGCIRLQQPMALLNYLFEQKRLNKQQSIEKHLIDGGTTRHYALKKSLPLYITRINVWVDENGLLNFRPS